MTPILSEKKIKGQLNLVNTLVKNCVVDAVMRLSL